MKKSLRFASAALALTLAASMTMPAFAAGKSDFAKSENVYAVMNADGSIKSTTVSEHLYNANGLSGVNPFRFGIGGAVSYRGFGVYVRYGITPLFRSSAGPTCHPLSFGVCIFM